MAEFSGNLTGVRISSRISVCNYFFNIFLRGKGWAWETAEKKTVKQYEWVLKEKQITQEPTYIVWEVVTANILGLFSSSTPCYLRFRSSLVLMRACGGSLFGTLFFDIQFLTLPRSKYSLVSWLDWSPAAGKTRPQQRIQRARKLSLYITGSWYHVQL